jgi:predicted N-formylglutamate amidohydrolase
LAASLTEGEDHPFLLVCEHAGNRIPKVLGTLGLTAEQLRMHIAWDIGAEGVARLLAKLLDAPLAMQRYSRLVYDCNRPPDSPGAMPEVSEATSIPGNTALSPAQKLQRIRDIYWPFHRGVSDFLDERAAQGLRMAIVTIHSFTRIYKGRERIVELGLLHDRDPEMALQLLKAFPNVRAALNEPYGPKDGVMHTTALHAEARGLRSVMVEIRNDLIVSERGQEEWAQRLSVPLAQIARA